MIDDQSIDWLILTIPSANNLLEKQILLFTVTKIQFSTCSVLKKAWESYKQC